MAEELGSWWLHPEGDEPPTWAKEQPYLGAREIERDALIRELIDMNATLLQPHACCRAMRALADAGNEQAILAMATETLEQELSHYLSGPHKHVTYYEVGETVLFNGSRVVIEGFDDKYLDKVWVVVHYEDRPDDSTFRVEPQDIEKLQEATNG